MTLSIISRWTLAFWLETLLVGGALMMLGWMSAGLGQLLVFCAIASLLLIAGSWLYHGGGRSLLLHLLLYPLVAGVGLLTFVTYDSWMIALILAGVFYWRIHSVSSEGIGHASLQRRFVLALMVCVMQLAVAGLYGSIAHPDTFDPNVYYGILVLVLGSYLLIALGAYVLREEALSIRVPVRLGIILGGQVLGTRLLLSAGYLVLGSALLGLLHLLWTWLKGPLGAGLYFLMEPALRALTEWIESLSEKMGKDQRVNNLLNNQGQGEEMPPQQVDAYEPLFSMLEPFLIGLVILVFLTILGRYMWKRRYQARHSPEKDVASASPAVYTSLDSTSDPDAAQWDVSQWFKKPVGPADDPVRYAYYQFLQEMASAELSIQPHETSQEFLQRIKKHPSLDPVRLELATQITGFYEQYRYQEKSLRDTELDAMKKAVQTLRFASPEMET
ncbi:DUF4129 domain-containing protein [Brevibacillus sp. NRS-1366]|uniref:DUF4129 domain-containing protein n=1 Tax=Brevibacillus sp. NRS-1366 TaxID=3233899 RepID=UPI003D1FA08D